MDPRRDMDSTFPRPAPARRGVSAPRRSKYSRSAFLYVSNDITARGCRGSKWRCDGGGGRARGARPRAETQTRTPNARVRERRRAARGRRPAIPRLAETTSHTRENNGRASHISEEMEITNPLFKDLKGAARARDGEIRPGRPEEISPPPRPGAARGSEACDGFHQVNGCMCTTLWIPKCATFWGFVDSFWNPFET